MRRRRYLAATAAVLLAGSGCLGRESPTDTFVTPSPTDPLAGTFGTPADSNWWHHEFDSAPTLYDTDDLYVKTDGSLDRIAPDGTREWSVETYTDPWGIVSTGSNLYHASGSNASRSVMMARGVGNGDELWTHGTHGVVMAASESAVIVGEPWDDLSTEGVPVYALGADAGEERWRVETGTTTGAVVTHDLCLVPHWKATLSAFDAATGDSRWEREHGVDSVSLEVVGDAVYFLTEFDATAYSLPEGEQLWHRTLRHQQRASAIAAPGLDQTDTIVTGSREGTLHGFDAETGETRWAIDPRSDDIIFGMARGKETIVVNLDETLLGYDVESGEEKWRQDLSPLSDVRIPRAVDGIVFLLTASGDAEWHVDTFDLDTGRREWRHPLRGSSPDFGVSGGRFVVGTRTGDVYGFGAD